MFSDEESHSVMRRRTIRQDEQVALSSQVVEVKEVKLDSVSREEPEAPSVFAFVYRLLLFILTVVAAYALVCELEVRALSSPSLLSVFSFFGLTSRTPRHFSTLQWTYVLNMPSYEQPVIAASEPSATPSPNSSEQ